MLIYENEEKESYIANLLISSLNKQDIKILSSLMYDALIK